ncbi:elongation factor G [Acrasis kona]|uniref:Elongation factor G n=1 Tax=Acrasis kona TaxID=1008807 RepID=A0AAW2ZMS3_9EUKA
MDSHKVFALLLLITSALSQKYSFGGVLSQAKIVGAGEREVFSYECKTGSCMMTYFWTTSTWDFFDRTRIKYYIDEEPSPSIDGRLFMMHGVGYGVQTMFGHERAGKGAKTGGLYNTYRIPFAKKVRVTLSLPEGINDGLLWVIFRGVENAGPVSLSYDTQLTKDARLKLYTNEDIPLKPLQYIDLSNSNKSGALFQVTININSTGLNFIEGCVRAHLNQGKSMLVLGTGIEDYFQSAFTFNGGEFRYPGAGLNVKFPGDTGLSAYKFHTDDPFLFNDGLRLTLRNGDTFDPETNLKCVLLEGGQPVGSPQLSVVSSHTWVYEW